MKIVSVSPGVLLDFVVARRRLRLRPGKGFMQSACQLYALVCFIFIDGKKTKLHLLLYVSHLAAGQVLNFQIRKNGRLTIFTRPPVCSVFAFSEIVRIEKRVCFQGTFQGRLSLPVMPDPDPASRPHLQPITHYQQRFLVGALRDDPE